MTPTTHIIRKDETVLAAVWPAATLSVSHLDDALVLHAGSDYDPDDLNLVRRQLPHRHITLDGDTITIWPRPQEHQ